MNDLGRSPDGSGYSAEPEPEDVSAVPVSIPNADDRDGFFYVEWAGRPCPFCGEEGVSGKSPSGHFFAGCPDADCLAHNLAYDFVTVDHARAAWDQRYETSANAAEQPRVSIGLDMCAHGADRDSYCGYCGGYSKGAGNVGL